MGTSRASKMLLAELNKPVGQRAKEYGGKLLNSYKQGDLSKRLPVKQVPKTILIGKSKFKPGPVSNGIGVGP